MATRTALGLLLLFLLSAAGAVSAGGGHRHRHHGGGEVAAWFGSGGGGGVGECRGTVAECLGTEDEFELDSESSRRILATRRYISYDALRRNSVPCSRRGASYYNCRPGAQANPYSRGCSRITRCRS